MRNKSFIVAFILLALVLKASASFGYFPTLSFSTETNKISIDSPISVVSIKSKPSQEEKDIPKYLDGDVKYQNEEEDEDECNKLILSFNSYYFSTYISSIDRPFIKSTTNLPFKATKSLFILFSRLII